MNNPLHGTTNRNLIIVGVAEMEISNRMEDILVAQALGSCLGVAIYDPVIRVGALLHVMLPTSKSAPEKASAEPYMFVDTGVPQMFRKAYDLGANKHRLIVKVAGGSNITQGRDILGIGNRNAVMLRKLFWKNSVMIAAEDIGGNTWRTLYLEIATGRTWVRSQGEEWEI